MYLVATSTKVRNKFGFQPASQNSKTQASWLLVISHVSWKLQAWAITSITAARNCATLRLSTSRLLIKSQRSRGACICNFEFTRVCDVGFQILA